MYLFVLPEKFSFFCSELLSLLLEFLFEFSLKSDEITMRQE